MASKTVKLGSKVGLHARPAALFTKAAAAAGIPVTIAKADGKQVNAASILSVLTLNAGFGDEVTISAEGDNAEQVIADLSAMLERDLDA